MEVLQTKDKTYDQYKVPLLQHHQLVVQLDYVLGLGQAQEGLKPVRMLGGETGARHWRLRSWLLVLAVMVPSPSPSIVGFAIPIPSTITFTILIVSRHRGGYPQDARNPAIAQLPYAHAHAFAPAGNQNGGLGLHCNCTAQDGDCKW